MLMGKYRDGEIDIFVRYYFNHEIFVEVIFFPTIYKFIKIWNKNNPFQKQTNKKQEKNNKQQ